MPRIPKQYGPFIYGIIQSGITTGVASSIATFGALGLNAHAVAAWGVAWAIAWASMIPIVVAVSPLIQRAVLALTKP